MSASSRVYRSLLAGTLCLISSGLTTSCHATKQETAVVAEPHGAAAAVGQRPEAPRAATPAASPPSADGYLYNDCHVHLTNYIQEGPDVRAFLEVMGDKVGRSALFGIPLQQLWSNRVSGDYAPTYYLNADTPLYYYSFTDAFIAMAYRSLSKEQQARFDPMITGFNPADMYGADHIKRVLLTFPGVFSGIGEFSIHKEFVSAKVAGEVASLRDPALDKVLDVAEETGLLVLIHNDMDVPFAKPGDPPVYLEQMKTVLRRHPRATIVWAHVGLGRVVHPVQRHVDIIRAIVEDPSLSHVYFDISWDEVAKYLLHDERTIRVSSELLNRHSDRFLFGSDEVSPSDPEKYFHVYEDYAPLWSRLSPEASERIRKKNYERLFDRARARVRAWEAAQAKR